MMNVCFCSQIAGNIKLHFGTDDFYSVELLNMYLDYGDLSEGVFSDKRLAEADSVFCDEWMYDSVFTDEYIKELKESMQRIKTHLNQGKRIRIWFDGSVDEYCSFLYLVSLFYEYCDQISFVDARNMGFDDHVFVPWIESNYCNIPSYIEKEQPLTNELMLLKTKEWYEICKDGSMLRVFENGRVKGVSIDYYDKIIESVIPCEMYRSDLVFRDLLQLVGNKIPYELMLNRLSKIVRNGNYKTGYFQNRENNTNLPYIERITFTKPAEQSFNYCVVGNIKQTRIDKDGILRNGTPAFSGGTKVYLCGKIWDFNREEIGVLGLCRGKRFYVDYISVDLIENIRCSKTYKPKVLEIMDNWEFEDGWWNGSKADKKATEAFVEKWTSVFKDNKHK